MQGPRSGNGEHGRGGEGRAGDDGMGNVQWARDKVIDLARPLVRTDRRTGGLRMSPERLLFLLFLYVTITRPVAQSPPGGRGADNAAASPP